MFASLLPLSPTAVIMHYPYKLATRQLPYAGNQRNISENLTFECSKTKLALMIFMMLVSVFHMRITSYTEYQHIGKNLSNCPTIY